MRTIRVLYTGPGLSGRSTSLSAILPGYRDLRDYTERDRVLRAGCVVSDRGVSRPLELAELGFRALALTVEAALECEYADVRERGMYLQGFLPSLDGVLMVVDSHPFRMAANQDCLERVVAQLGRMGRDPSTVPFVFQLNKRDLPDALPVPAYIALLHTPRCFHVKSVATRGEGVKEALARLVSMIVDGPT